MLGMLLLVGSHLAHKLLRYRQKFRAFIGYTHTHMTPGQKLHPQLLLQTFDRCR